MTNSSLTKRVRCQSNITNVACCVRRLSAENYGCSFRLSPLSSWSLIRRHWSPICRSISAISWSLRRRPKRNWKRRRRKRRRAACSVDRWSHWRRCLILRLLNILDFREHYLNMSTLNTWREVSESEARQSARYQSKKSVFTSGQKRSRHNFVGCSGDPRCSNCIPWKITI